MPPWIIAFKCGLLNVCLCQDDCLCCREAQRAGDLLAQYDLNIMSWVSPLSLRYYSHFWPTSHNTETFCRPYCIFLCLLASVLTFLFPRVLGNEEGLTGSELPVNHGSGISKIYLLRPLLKKNEHLHFQKVSLKPAEVSNYYWGLSSHSCQKSVYCSVKYMCLSQN